MNIIHSPSKHRDRAVPWDDFLLGIRDHIDTDCSIIPRSYWHYAHEMEVYLRNGRCFVNGKVALAITVSNIQVYDEHRGKGFYDALLKYIEDHTTMVYIENVLNESQYAIYLKRGYQPITSNDGSPISCFYKIIPK